MKKKHNHFMEIPAFICLYHLWTPPQKHPPLGENNSDLVDELQLPTFRDSLATSRLPIPSAQPSPAVSGVLPGVE